MLDLKLAICIAILAVSTRTQSFFTRSTFKHEEMQKIEKNVEKMQKTLIKWLTIKNKTDEVAVRFVFVNERVE